MEKELKELLEAAKIGDIETLETILSKYAKKLGKSKISHAFRVAAMFGQIPALECLLEAGAKISEGDSDNRTAIMLAAQKGFIDTVTFLISNGSKLNDKDYDGNYPIHHAVLNNQLKFVDFLLTRYPFLIKQRDSSDLTPLLLAIKKGHYDLVELLLNKGASLKETSNEFFITETALTLAVGYGRFITVRLLLNKGGYLNPKDSIEYPLNLKFDSWIPGQLSQVRDTNVRARDLFKAAVVLMSEALKPIPMYGEENPWFFQFPTECYSLNARDFANGNTALHYAILNKRVKLAVCLLKAGADMELENNDKKTAYQLVEASKNPYLIAHCNLAKLRKSLKKSEDSKEDKEHKEDIEVELVELKTTKEVEKVFQTTGTVSGEYIIQLHSKLDALLNKNQKSEICLEFGELISNPLNSMFDPINAYKLLIQVNPEDKIHYEKANEIIYHLINDFHLLLQPQIDLVPGKQSFIPIRLDGKSRSFDEPTSLVRLFRQRSLIHHALKAGRKVDESLLKQITDYAFPDKTKSSDSFVDVLDSLREMTMMNSRCFAELKSLKEEFAKLKDALNSKDISHKSKEVDLLTSPAVLTQFQQLASPVPPRSAQEIVGDSLKPV